MAGVSVVPPAEAAASEATAPAPPPAAEHLLQQVEEHHHLPEVHVLQLVGQRAQAPAVRPAAASHVPHRHAQHAHPQQEGEVDARAEARVRARVVRGRASRRLVAARLLGPPRAALAARAAAVRPAAVASAARPAGRVAATAGKHVPPHERGECQQHEGRLCRACRPAGQALQPALCTARAHPQRGQHASLAPRRRVAEQAEPREQSRGEQRHATPGQ
eukprot:scaffold7895_cov57-Phaeocystis_antarctica.AAC.1